MGAERSGGSFVRNPRGEVIAVWIVGLSSSPLRYEKLGQTGNLPLELLFDGKGKEAYRGISRECGYSELLGAGRMFFKHFPTRTRVAIAYFEGLAKQFGDSSDAHALLGRAYVAANMRPRAIESFRRARALNAGNRLAVDCLVRLHALPVPSDVEAAQWRVPLSLNDLFRPPASLEIREVQQRWTGRTTGMAQRMMRSRC